MDIHVHPTLCQFVPADNCHPRLVATKIAVSSTTTSKGIQNHSGTKIYVSAENIKEIAVFDFSKLHMDSTLHATNLYLKSAGSSEINLKDVIIDEELKIKASDFSKIRLHNNINSRAHQRNKQRRERDALGQGSPKGTT